MERKEIFYKRFTSYDLVEISAYNSLFLNKTDIHNENPSATASSHPPKSHSTSKGKHFQNMSSLSNVSVFVRRVKAHDLR